MKKLVFGLIATVMLGLNANAKEVVTTTPIENSKEVVTTNPDDSRTTITISIDWGRKSRDCRGFGICSITVDIDLEISPIDIFFRASSNDKGNLVLELTDKGLQNVKSTFGSNTIVIEEDFKVSEQDCKNLELKAGYTVKAGKYTVNKSADGTFAVVL